MRRSGRMPTDQFDQWVGQWYRDLSPEPFVALIRKGTVLVIEDADSVDDLVDDLALDLVG